MKHITIESCEDCPCIHPENSFYCREIGAKIFDNKIIDPYCTLPDQVEPDRDKWFAEELERRWPKPYLLMEVFNGDPYGYNWLKSELTKERKQP